MNRFIILTFLIGTLWSCSQSDINTELSQTIEITNQISIMAPEGIVLEPLQGIDTYLAQIVDPNDDSFLIFMDIGFLAGQYVNEDDRTVMSDRSVSARFNYEIRESQYLSDEDCCVFFTFPTLGPANFISYNNEHFDTILNMMRSLKVE